MKLKPPTAKDNPKQKKINRKRKFEDEQSLIKINKKFLSVDKGRLSNNPQKITKPSDSEMERCTDSKVGRHSTHVQGDDVSKPGPSSAGQVTLEISNHVKPDLAESN